MTNGQYRPRAKKPPRTDRVTLDDFVAAWPAVFKPPTARRLPLRTGIYHDIKTARPTWSWEDIQTVLRDYTGSLSYLLALTMGAFRVDLNGRAAGIVTDTQAGIARATAKARIAAKALASVEARRRPPDRPTP